MWQLGSKKAIRGGTYTENGANLKEKGRMSRKLAACDRSDPLDQEFGALGTGVMVD